MRNILKSPRGAVLSLSLFLLASPGLAASKAELDILHDALGTEELFLIMREEGLRQSEELREEMFPGRGGQSWSALVFVIYDIPTISEDFRTTFDAALADTDAGPLIAFFTSERGRKIVQLELEARRAILEPEVEEAAREAFRRMDAEGDGRVLLVRDFVKINDLVEYNVMGAMNANLAFMNGMTEGEGFDMSEADILADVWEREADIRTDTDEWVHSYLAMAYLPLDEADIRAYSELSATEAGQDLNRALFAGFDTVFNKISYALGQTVSRFVVSEDL